MPRFISFAWTTPALLADGPLQKTCTRRDWAMITVKAAEKAIISREWWWAMDRNPRVHGRRVARIIPISIERQSTKDMPDGDYIAEGFAWFDQPENSEQRDLALAALAPQLLGPRGLSGPTMRALFDDWRNARSTLWVLRFERVEVL